MDSHKHNLWYVVFLYERMNSIAEDITALLRDDLNFH